MTNPRPTFRQADFRKSGLSDPDRDCVEVARRAGWVQLRDSKTAFGGPGDGRLTVPAARFAAFRTRWS
jgi:hypothetical protein